MIMITTRQAPQPTRLPDQQALEYVFATVDGRWQVHVVRRGVRSWAIRLGGFALHRDGCFWPAPDTPPVGGNALGGTDPEASGRPSEPAYALDEAIARTLHALVRLP